MKRALGPALLALGLACAAPPPPAVSCSITQRPIDRFFMLGERADVLATVNELCLNNTDETLHTATSVTAEVRDPDGTVVASLVSVPKRVAQGLQVFSNDAVVSFTPDRPGAYRVTTQFEPSIGRTAGTAVVIADRADAGARIAQGLFTSACEGWGMTARGTVVCVYRHATSGYVLLTQRGDSMRREAFAIDGDAIRSVASNGLERHEDDGAGLRQTHFTSLALPPPQGLAATATGAWVSTPAGTPGMNELFFLTPLPDAGLARAPRALPSFRTDGLAPHADGVLLAGTAEPSGAPALGWLSGDGGAFTTGFGSFGLLGGQPGALWLQTTRIGVAALGDGGVQLTFAQQPAGGFSGAVPTPIFPMAPLLSLSSNVQNAESAQRVAARFDGTAVGFERFVAGDGYLISGATPTHVFARAINGESVKVFDR